MNETTRYLYRGVNPELYEKTGGKLVPKTTNSFTYTFKYGERGIKYGSGATYGSSPTNAVLRHQHNQEGYPTSGISTTPHLVHAQDYAINKDENNPKGKYKYGYIYKIDRGLLKINGVLEWVVSDYVTRPSIPDDDEVILVEKSFGTLPDAIIAEVTIFEAPITDEKE